MSRVLIPNLKWSSASDPNRPTLEVALLRGDVPTAGDLADLVQINEYLRWGSGLAHSVTAMFAFHVWDHGDFRKSTERYWERWNECSEALGIMVRIEIRGSRWEQAQLRGALGSLESLLTARGDQALLAEENRVPPATPWCATSSKRKGTTLSTTQTEPELYAYKAESSRFAHSWQPVGSASGLG